MLYRIGTANKVKSEQTSDASKYPQGYFKDKPCKECGKSFTPKAPSEMYCSDTCKDRGITSAYMNRQYGITYADYEYMLESQDHKCKICGREGYTMDPKRHLLKLVIDHDHATGIVRGLLCHDCNRALGLLHDEIDTLKAAINYLEGATTIRKE